MKFDQGELNFNASGSQEGWRKWREELEIKKREFESRWGVVLGKRVTISLRNHEKPLSGILDWINPTHPSTPPLFRLRGLEFTRDEIESVVQDPQNNA